MFITNEPLTASLLIQWATAQGWVKEGGGSKPIIFRDENGTVRLKLKKGSPRTYGSQTPHAEFRDALGRRVDRFGNPVSRKSKENHTAILWDI